MHTQGHLRPIKWGSGLVIVCALLLALIGITLVIPQAPVLGLVWTAAAIVITAYHAVNLLAEDSAAYHAMGLDLLSSGRRSRVSENASVKARLEELEALRKDSHITDQEYAEQRRRILGEL